MYCDVSMGIGKHALDDALLHKAPKRIQESRRIWPTHSMNSVGLKRSRDLLNSVTFYGAYPCCVTEGGDRSHGRYRMMVRGSRELALEIS